MKTGRPRNILDQAIMDLKDVLSFGPKPAEDIYSALRAGRHTLQKAKNIIGAKSKKIGERWFWYIPTKEELALHHESIAQLRQAIDYNQSKAARPGMTDSLNLAADVFGNISETDKTPQYTRDIIRMTKYHHFNVGESEEEIQQLMISECRMFPTNPPYSDDYIKAVIHHVICDAPKPELPEGNKE